MTLPGKLRGYYPFQTLHLKWLFRKGSLQTFSNFEVVFFFVLNIKFLIFLSDFNKNGNENPRVPREERNKSSIDRERTKKKKKKFSKVYFCSNEK